MEQEIKPRKKESAKREEIYKYFGNILGREITPDEHKFLKTVLKAYVEIKHENLMSEIEIMRTALKIRKEERRKRWMEAQKAKQVAI